MLNTNALPPRILADLLDAFTVPDADGCITHPDHAGLAKVSKLSVHSAFDTWLTYLGIIGYTDQIILALDGIREAAESHRQLSAEFDIPDDS